MQRITNLLAIMICCAATAFGFAEAQRTIRKTVTIPSGKRLWIDHSQGDVVVRVQAGDQAVINAVVRCSADTAAIADRICASIDVKVEETSNGVTVRTAYPTDTSGERVGFRVDYNIAVPETTFLEVANRFGAVAVSDTRANVIIRNSNGPVNIRDIGGLATVTNSFGRTHVNNAAGVIVDSTSGAVDVENVSERSARIINSFGPVFVTNVKTDVFIQNRSGDINVSNVGEHATVTNTFGSVALRQVKGGVTVNAGNSPVLVQKPGGEVSIRTTYQGVVVKEAANAVKIENQNGPITLEPSAGRCWPITLTSKFAPIRVALPAGTGYALNAQTTFGRIDSPDIEIEGSEQHVVSAKTAPAPQHLSLLGQIPGGDCPLRLVNQNGNIEITRAK